HAALWGRPVRHPYQRVTVLPRALGRVGGGLAVVQREIGYPMPLLERPKHLVRPNPAALVHRMQQLGLDPENVHAGYLDPAAASASAPPAGATASPSTKIRCQCSRLTRAHSRSEWSASRASCSATRRRSASGSNSPRSSARGDRTYSSIWLFHAPRNHSPTGTGNPILRRERISGGSLSFIACRNTYLVVVPRSLSRSGSRAVNSTSS